MRNKKIGGNVEKLDTWVLQMKDPSFACEEIRVEEADAAVRKALVTLAYDDHSSLSPQIKCLAVSKLRTIVDALTEYHAIGVNAIAGR